MTRYDSTFWLGLCTIKPLYLSKDSFRLVLLAEYRSSQHPRPIHLRCLRLSTNCWAMRSVASFIFLSLSDLRLDDAWLRLFKLAGPWPRTKAWHRHRDLSVALERASTLNTFKQWLDFLCDPWMPDDMASIPTTSKGKQRETTQSRSVSSVQGRDWRYWINYEEDWPLMSSEQLSILKCPFSITSEKTHSIFPPYSKNVAFYVATDKPGLPPWTSYYATYQGRLLPIANAYGVWFKIQWRNKG